MAYPISLINESIFKSIFKLFCFSKKKMFIFGKFNDTQKKWFKY